MKKLLTVIKREYFTRIRTKGFIIGTILLPIFILGMTVLPAVLAFIKSEEQQKIAVIDMSGEIFEALLKELDETNDAGQRIYLLQKMAVSKENLAAVKQNLQEEVDKGKIRGLLYIPAEVLNKNVVEYYAKNVSNFRQNSELQDAVSQVVRRKRIVEAGLEPKMVQKLTQKVQLKTYKVGPGGKEKEERGQTFILTYILVFFLYMALIFYGAFVMRAVIEEKTSRVVEVLVSSIRPFQLMAGKILGVGSVGLTQFLIWAIAAALISTYSGMMIHSIGGFDTGSTDILMPEISLTVLVYFVLFFILGYILFATMYAAVGAMVNSDQEGQQLQFPLISLLVVPIIMMTFIISNPNATSSVIMSMIPFFSPIIMFTRIVVDMPPFLEILLSIAILVITIFLMIMLAGKIFRVGILMYGKRPTLPEVIRWIRYS